MCEIMEKYIEEAEAAAFMEAAIRAVSGGDMTVERAAEVFGVPLEQLKEKLANR